MPRTILGCLAPALLGISVAAGCSDESERSIDAYCELIRTDEAMLESPAIATAADIAATLDLYAAIAATAPAAVEPEWQTVIESLTVAASVVPGDATSLEVVHAAALAGQPAYTRIQQYTQRSCGIDIGTPPPVTNPVIATTTTVPTTG
jgi:ABC-type spermidine/putrescine transport system permease subunit II